MLEASFCIITQPRTGSNHLCALLDSHPEITCHYELFNRWRIYSNFDERNGRVNLLKRQLRPVHFLEELRAHTAVRCPQARAFGFKLMLSQSRAALRHIVRSSDYKKILLYRENKLAQYSSEKIALRTRQYVARDRSNAATTKIEFVPEEFERFLESNQRAYTAIKSELRSSAQLVIEIEYRQLDDQDVLSELLKFIGVGEHALQDRTVVRQNPPAVLSRFSNPETALATLGETPMSRWLA